MKLIILTLFLVSDVSCALIEKVHLGEDCSTELKRVYVSNGECANYYKAIDDKQSEKIQCNADNTYVALAYSKNDCDDPNKMNTFTTKQPSGTCVKINGRTMRITCPQTNPKSNLSTGAIIGITIGSLLIIVLGFKFVVQPQFSSQQLIVC